MGVNEGDTVPRGCGVRGQGLPMDITGRAQKFWTQWNDRTLATEGSDTQLCFLTI